MLNLNPLPDTDVEVGHLIPDRSAGCEKYQCSCNMPPITVISLVLKRQNSTNCLMSQHHKARRRHQCACQYWRYANDGNDGSTAVLSTNDLFRRGEMRGVGRRFSDSGNPDCLKLISDEVTKLDLKLSWLKVRRNQAIRSSDYLSDPVLSAIADHTGIQ